MPFLGSVSYVCWFHMGLDVSSSMARCTGCICLLSNGTEGVCWRKKDVCTCTARKSGLWVFLRPHEQIVSINLSILQPNANFSICSIWTSLPSLHHIVEFSSKLFSWVFDLQNGIISSPKQFPYWFYFLCGERGRKTEQREIHNRKSQGSFWKVIVLNVPGNIKCIAETKDLRSVKLTSLSSIFYSFSPPCPLVK